jgi:alkylated DNA repair dioxygenase AlkB
LTQQDGRVRYWSDVLGQDADAYLDASVRNVPWRAERIKMYGREHPVPRLSAWFSDTGASYRYSGITMQGAPLPGFVARIRASVFRVSGHYFNSVLLNYYRDGRDKVGWHSDNEPELGADVLIASVSLGACRVFRLRHKSLPQSCDIRLAHGSLLLMEPPMQNHWEHCLPARPAISQGRVNLSFRNIA